MNGLIIDTSRDPAILGYSKDGRIEKIVLIEGAKNLSATLFPALEAFCKIKDLDYIAIGVGPGSYMGIRTGATIAKTLAFAANLPLIEFVSPLAFLPKNQNGTFAFIGDAKMGQLYLLTGDTESGEISSPQLLNPDQLQIEKKDFIVGPLYLDPEPNLDLVAPLVHGRFIQKKFSPSLELTYLR